MTTRSPLFKQLTCGVPGCGRKADRRVSYAISQQIFTNFARHVPIGAGFTNTLRKLFFTSISGACYIHRRNNHEAPSDQAELKQNDNRQSNFSQERDISFYPKTVVRYHDTSAIGVELSDADINNRIVTPELSEIANRTMALEYPILNPSMEIVTLNSANTCQEDVLVLGSKRKNNDEVEGSTFKKVGSVSGSQESKPSQGSNFSDCSDVDIRQDLRSFEKELKNKKLKTVLSTLKELKINVSESTFKVLDKRTFKLHVETLVSDLCRITIELVNMLTLKEDMVSKTRLLEAIAVSFSVQHYPKKCLSEAVLSSIKEYLVLLKSDLSRDGNLVKKLILESVSGQSIRENNLLSQLAEELDVRKATVLNNVDNRIKFETEVKIVPIVSRLQRRSPVGDKFISTKWKLDAYGLYENQLVSDVLKGYHNVKKERCRSKDGSQILVILRQKRVLKVNSIQLFALAKSEINWPFGLRSLLSLRPDWVLLPSSRYMVSCLCEKCQNLTLAIRALKNFLDKAKNGSATQKLFAMNFPIFSSVSTLIDILLHPCDEGSDIHPAKCLMQTCENSEEPCGIKKYDSIFFQMLNKFGTQQIDVFQHEKLQYIKPDGSSGIRYELRKQDVSLDYLVQKIRFTLFQGKEPFLIHQLRKELGKQVRKDLRQHLLPEDIIIYSDFSKELELTNPETLKNEGFGASHKTYQIIPQVYELTVKVPSAPQDLIITNGALSFSKPRYSGGGNIQYYEVHLKEVNTDIWYLYSTIPVKPMTADPVTPDTCLSSLSGCFNLKICARNMAGVGASTEARISLGGQKTFSSLNLTEISESWFDTSYCTFWEEHIFVSDHRDSPKDWKSIRSCIKTSLASIRSYHERQIKRAFHVTDTGGENWGTQALASYSWSLEDFEVLSVWCPTPANHSGQPSDSAGGTFKSFLINEARAGNTRGLNTAEQIVDFCKGQPMFRQSNQAKYLNATLTRRSYYHITAENVEGLTPKNLINKRSVKPLAGVSKWKQAFSVGSPNKLLVREFACCCCYCLDRDFTNCRNLDYVKEPQLITFTFQRCQPRITRASSAANIVLLEPVHNEQFYIVKSDSNEGFDIVKCIAVSQEYFEGLRLEKTADENNLSLFNISGMIL